MFLSDSHLPHLLHPALYSDTTQFNAEIERLFHPTWHCIASTSDFVRERVCHRFDLLGTPLILQRIGDRIVVNRDPRGERLCRPSKAANDSPRIQVVDGLVFVSLSNECRPIEAFLNGNADFVSELFSSDWEPILTVPQLLPANWKTLVENILESYHLETVHRETFKSYPSADACFHEITPTWTSYTERNDSEHSELRGGADHVSRRLGVAPHPHYRHVIIYPHFVMARMGLFSWAQTILPVAPRQTLNFWQFFMLRGKRRSGGAIVTAKILRHWGRRFFKKALAEDAEVLCGVQAGLDSAAHPHGGLISTREERIFHFQRYILDHAGEVPAGVEVGNTAIGSR